jgi:hypothetical protein
MRKEDREYVCRWSKGGTEKIEGTTKTSWVVNGRGAWVGWSPERHI